VGPRLISSQRSTGELVKVHIGMERTAEDVMEERP
jgi:hypothetical protein